MASRRAEKQRCSQLDSSQTKFKVADAFELTKSVSVDEDPIHLWDASHKTPVEGTPQLNKMITFGPLYADSLCTQWSDDAIASNLNPLDAESLCTKWSDDATVASQTVPLSVAFQFQQREVFCETMTKSGATDTDTDTE